MGRRRTKNGTPKWASYSDEDLLDVRMCDLGVRVKGCPIEPLVERTLRDLERRELRIKPNFWFGDEWFTPVGATGISIPFYLAHPRLARLERAQMLEVEGGTPDSFLRILRHEIGHVVDNAWQLRRRRRRQKLFGLSSVPYPEAYLPKPYSKSYVRHLKAGYAQSHPDEDFAETFAVWFTPRSPWRRRYAGWKALRKLEYLDELMGELRGQRPQVRSRREVDPVSSMKITLREHYEEKRDRYAVGHETFYDRDLMRVFTGSPDDRTRPTAAAFIRRHRRTLGGTVARWSGVYRYTVKVVVEDMIGRCRALGLRVGEDEDEALLNFSVLVTVHTMNVVREGKHHISL